MGVRLVCLFIITAATVSCKKSTNENRCDAYYTITFSDSSPTTTVATGITSFVRGFGATGCYQFAGSEVRTGLSNSFEIRLKGTVPCDASVCPQFAVVAQDNIHIPTTTAGIYYLKFFNGPTLFEIDTVVVN